MHWPIQFKIGKCERDIQKSCGIGIECRLMYIKDGWIYSPDKKGPLGRNWWRWGN